MNNKTNTIDVLNVLLNVTSNLSGNMAGGALLANILYDNWDLRRWDNERYIDKIGWCSGGDYQRNNTYDIGIWFSRRLSKLFENRMEVAKKIGEYKKLHNLNILDASREEIVLEKAKHRIKNKNLEEYYLLFVQNLMELSKKYQNE